MKIRPVLLPWKPVLKLPRRYDFEELYARKLLFPRRIDASYNSPEPNQVMPDDCQRPYIFSGEGKSDFAVAFDEVLQDQLVVLVVKFVNCGLDRSWKTRTIFM